MTPVQRADSTPKGQLKNPYSDSDAAVVQAGQQLYMSYACSGCHGGTGGSSPPGITGIGAVSGSPLARSA